MFHSVKGLSVYCQGVDIVVRMSKVDDKLFAFLGIQLEFIDSAPLFDTCNCILDMTICFNLDNFRYGCVINEFPATDILELYIINYQHKQPRT